MGEYVRGAGRIRGSLCNMYAVASAMSKRTSLLDICWDVLMGLWEGTKSPLTLGPRYIPTPAPDLIGAIGTAVAIALGPDVLHRLQTLCVQYVLRSQAQCQK